MLYKIVQPWLDPNTRSKIVVIKGNPAERLLQDIDADQVCRLLLQLNAFAHELRVVLAGCAVASRVRWRVQELQTGAGLHEGL